MLRERLIPLPDIFPTEPWAAGAKGLDSKLAWEFAGQAETMCVSSASTASMEDIGKASSTSKWFQMYLNVDKGLSREVLQRVPPRRIQSRHTDS
jgi:hypothetical protein